MTRLATRARDRLADPLALAHAHGVSTMISGAWPLLSLRSFEAVFGPKEDRWLVYTVSGMLVTNGLGQVLAAREGAVSTARALGCGTAGTLLAIDLVFVPAGRIRWTYLFDAAYEAVWIGLWRRARTS